MTSASVERIERVHVLSLDEIICGTVRGLRGARGADVNELARYIGISRGSFYSRLNGSTQFAAAEIGKLAEWFDVPVTDFYEGIVRVSSVPASEPVTHVSYDDERGSVIAFPMDRIATISHGDADSAAAHVAPQVTQLAAGRTGEHDTAA